MDAEGSFLDWVSTDEFLKSRGHCKGLLQQGCSQSKLRDEAREIAQNRLIAVDCITWRTLQLCSVAIRRKRRQTRTSQPRGTRSQPDEDIPTQPRNVEPIGHRE